MMDNNGGFHFISTIIDVELELPVDITATLRLEKATDAQIEIISKHVYDYQYYKRDTHCTKETETVKSYSYTILPEEKWRYFIISFTGNGNEAIRFFNIADLVCPNIQSTIYFWTSEKFGMGDKTGFVVHHMSNAATNWHLMTSHTDTKKFNNNSLKNLQCLFEKYNELYDKRDEYAGILQAIEFNRELKGQVHGSKLFVLGLFVIIEMLLTHNPNDKEVGDSLSHQIKTKMAFLSNRFIEPLDYSVFGKQATLEKTWGSLYEYRSRIAHGNNIDFNDKGLKILKDAETAFEFLIAATRVLLAYALAEPDIINGLKPI